MKKKPNTIFILLWICCCLPAGNLFAADAPEGERVVGLPDHELGDMTLGMDLGLFVPLTFMDFTGNFTNTNLSLGGAASLQWNAYLAPFFRLGADIGGSFNLSPQQRTLLLMPILLKGTFVFNISRFEFPLYLGAGINIVRYRDWSQLDFIIKTGAGAFWRYDANWAFGLNLSWLWDFQPVTKYQSPDQARMAHYLAISPALIYQF